MKYILQNDCENRKKPIEWIKSECLYPELGECHVCISHYKNKQGYIRVFVKGKLCILTRYVWELNFGEISEGLYVLHKCDNPSCINSKHLFLGTNHENVLDSVKKGRHKYTPHKGEKHWNSKLTRQQILEIKKDNRLHREIAKDYGVARRTISEIKNETRWKHIVI